MDMDSYKKRWINRNDTQAEYFTRVLSRKRSIKEHAAVSKYLASITSQYTRPVEVADAPVGTGRFFSLYKEFGIKVYGCDISTAMLRRAGKEADKLRYPVDLIEADIVNLPLPYNAVDVAICMRFLVHLEPESMQLVLQELSRVSRENILFGLRIYDWDPVALRYLHTLRAGIKQIKNGLIKRKPYKTKSSLCTHRFLKTEIISMLAELKLDLASYDELTTEQRGTNLVFHVRKSAI